MTKLSRLVSIGVLACAALATTCLWAADAPKKNWTPPAHKIYPREYFAKAAALRDSLAEQILNYKALFEPTR
jgi:hypothetical protein